MKHFSPFILVLLILCSQASAKQTLTLSKPGPHDPVASIATAVLVEAYSRLDIEIITHIFPAERSLNISNRGQVDGEVARISGLENKYPNLVRIPIPINWLEGVVFTQRKDIEVSGWDSLVPYTIAIRIGSKFAEIGTKGMKVQAISTNDQLFRMLKEKRVDLVVCTRMEGQMIIKRLKLDEIKMLEPPLVTLRLFHYLHKKHSSLIPALTLVLQTMEKQGRIHTIRQAAIAGLE